MCLVTVTACRTLFLSPAAARPAVKNRNSVHTPCTTPCTTHRNTTGKHAMLTRPGSSLSSAHFVCHHPPQCDWFSFQWLRDESKDVLAPSFPCPSCPGVPSTRTMLSTQQLSQHISIHTFQRRCQRQPGHVLSRLMMEYPGVDMDSSEGWH